VILSFPDFQVFRLALTCGAVPDKVSLAPAQAAVDDAGRVWLSPVIPLSKAEAKELRRLGVSIQETCALSLEPLCCWLQLLPLERAAREPLPTDKTPVLFELADEALLPELVGEILRLGNDRQSFRLLEEVGIGRALLRVIGPPYYSLLRALDRRDSGPRAYRELSPRVWVQVGYVHPLAEQIRPPAGKIVLMRSPRHWTFLDEVRFRDIYEILDFALPATASTWQESTVDRKLTVPVRLSPGGAGETAELWVVRENPVAQLDELVRSSDDQLLSRLAFAVGEREGRQVIVLRVRPSRSPPPVLVLKGIGFRPFLRLPNLFLPCGSRLHPPLRRDAVARLLAPDARQVTWLQPGPEGHFTPENLPDEAFRPLSQWVDYVLDHEHEALTAWVQSTRFDFESFVCRDDQPGQKSPPKIPPKKPRGDKEDRPAQPQPGVEKETAGRTRRDKNKDEPALDFNLPTQPGELEQRLRELEKTFLALEGPPDDARRQELWPEMAQHNAALGQRDETAICWGHALWEHDSTPATWLHAWFQAERRATTEVSVAPVRALLSRSVPTGSELRMLVIVLLAAVQARPMATELRPLLGEVQKYLEKHEGLLGIRLSWLAWQALHRLAHGDVLALARARDRLLERLYQTGLSADLDLPGFVRFTGLAASERFRQVRDQLLRLRPMVHQWLKRDPAPGPETPQYADLMFAYGLARLGDSTESQHLLREVGQQLREKDFVHDWLFRAFEFRIRQALEGKGRAGPLPQEMLTSLDVREQEDLTGLDAKTLGNIKSEIRLDRYKIDSLRKQSRILEPHEKIDPYRRWVGRYADELSQQLALLFDITDHSELAARLGKMIAPAKGRSKVMEPRVLVTALELSPRLGEVFAGGMLEKVEQVLEKVSEPLQRILLLEKALFVAGHFDKNEVVQRLLARLHTLLEGESGSWPMENLESLLGHTFRSLRKLGLRAEVGRLLQRLSEVIQKDPALAGAGSSGKVLPLLLQVAGGWLYFGQNDQGRRILDQARALLFKSELYHVDQTKLACAYVATLGQGPVELALSRLAELLRRIKNVRDLFTPHTHYCRSQLELVEAVVLALVCEDFTVAPEARRWLDDDEYLVRRRIHRDMRAALNE
jgi:hypothetical protein